MSRILGAIRQSRTEDASTSVDAQRDRIRAYAALHGHEVIGFAIDTDTSGFKVAPFDRPQLGPWLADRQDQYDMIVSSKLDRVGRNVRDFADLVSWCREHGKTIACVAEGFDLTTPAGRLTANVLIAIAEFQWEGIRTARLETIEQLTRAGRFAGGHAPFGYRAVETPGKGWRLEQDELSAWIVRKLIDMTLSGKSSPALLKWLHDCGITSPRGRETWHGRTVRDMLRSPTLAGMVVTWTPSEHEEVDGGTLVTAPSRSVPVLDAQGLPIRSTDEPIVDDETYERLQAVLRGRIQANRGPSIDTHLLTQVVFCGLCERPMYALKRTSRRSGGWYRCIVCPRVSVQLLALEEDVERLVLREAGSRQLTRRQVVRGDDHSREIARLEARLKTRRADLAADPGDEGLEQSLSRGEAKLAELKAMPHEPDRIEWVPVGVTIAEHWAALDKTGRNQLLREYRVRVAVDREGWQITTGYLTLNSDEFREGSPISAGPEIRIAGLAGRKIKKRPA